MEDRSNSAYWDDDGVSLELAVQGFSAITVMDIDCGVLAATESKATRLGLKVKCSQPPALL